MKKSILLLLVSSIMVSCRGDFPITAKYFVTGDPAMTQAYHSNFGYLHYSDNYTEYIAGYVKHVYYNDKLILAQQDSLSYPTWYVIQPKEFDYLAGAWDDNIIGPITTEQRDSVLRHLNVQLKDLKHNDYTTWRYPKD